MSGGQSNQAEEPTGNLLPWIPAEQVELVSTQAVQYSLGFLQCRPERWFPGFSAQWMPLAHSLGSELRCIEVRPQILENFHYDNAYVGSVDNEPLAIMIDENSANQLGNLFIPSGRGQSQNILLEYLARRFMHSLSIAWGGAENSMVRFEPKLRVDAVKSDTAIRLVFSANGNNIAVMLLLGQKLAQKLDGLWRRQLLANSKLTGKARKVQIELAHLTVPPTMLSQYLKSGTDIDLDTPVSNSLSLQIDGSAWLPGKLIRVEHNLGFETVTGALASTAQPDGTTRLSIQFPEITLEPQQLIELAQSGAKYASNHELTDLVNLVVRNQKVGTGRLKVYEGRLAITVV